MRGKCLANSGSNKLRIDFAEVKHFKTAVKNTRHLIEQHEKILHRPSDVKRIYNKVRSPSSSPHCSHKPSRSRSPLYSLASSRQLKSPISSMSPLNQTNHSPKQSRRVITSNKSPSDQDYSLNILSNNKLTKSSSEPINQENQSNLMSNSEKDISNAKFNKLENFTITTIDNTRRIDFQSISNSTQIITPTITNLIEPEKIISSYIKNETIVLDNSKDIKTETNNINHLSQNISQKQMNTDNLNAEIETDLQAQTDNNKNLDLSIDASADKSVQQSNRLLNLYNLENSIHDTNDTSEAINILRKHENIDISIQILESEQSENSKQSSNLGKSSKSPDSTTTIFTENNKIYDEKDEGEIVDDQEMNNIQNIKNIYELTKFIIESDWSGSFTLKKHTFPIKFYLISGDKSYKNQIFKHIQSNELHINQRLRLDSSKLEDIEKKIYESISSNSLNSIYIALPNYNSQNELQQKRNLHNLTSYLDQKGAAGVIPLPDDDKPMVTIHLFTPNSSFSSKIIKKLFPSLLLNNESNNNSDFLIIVLLKTN